MIRGVNSDEILGDHNMISNEILCQDPFIQQIGINSVCSLDFQTKGHLA